MSPPYVVLTAIYCIAIYIASSNPDPGIPEMPFANFDKLLHAIAFGGLAALVAQGLRHSNQLYSKKVLFFVPIVFATCYGFFDECHQIFVPNRQFDVYDLLADFAGAVIALTFLMTIGWRPVSSWRRFIRSKRSTS